MELRWVCYSGTLAQIDAPAEAIWTKDGAMVLQHREGITHDAPWINVPITYYAPPKR
jgi:hypothetical protein